MGAIMQSDYDLRLYLPADKLGDFETWYNLESDREVTVYRELQEELVEEEGLVAHLDFDDLNLSFIKSVKRQDYSNEFSRQNFTHYFINYYYVTFSKQLENKILESIKNNSNCRLIYREELERRKTNDLITISKFSLDDKNKLIM